MNKTIFFNFNSIFKKRLDQVNRKMSNKKSDYKDASESYQYTYFNQKRWQYSGTI